MHLSHVSEDLEAWYINFDFRERVDTAFRPNLKVRENAQTVDQGPKQVSTVADVRREFKATGRIGHSAAIQTTSRLQADVVGPDGTVYPKGAAIPIRADFNTLDNPFAWSVQQGEVKDTPVAGIHFVVFNPSSDDFHRNRLAMDGVLPGAKIPFAVGSRGQGFNAVLTTTHRQNFLVPPRAHRSFPFAERWLCCSVYLAFPPPPRGGRSLFFCLRARLFCRRGHPPPAGNCHRRGPGAEGPPSGPSSLGGGGVFFGLS